MRFLSCAITGFLYVLSSPGLAEESKTALPQACAKQCATTFGTLLGKSKGVAGYSNCHPDCESDEWNIITIDGKSVKTGMKWQCVEYARRWLNQRSKYTFASIDHAYQIWDLQSATSLVSQQTKSWLKYANGTTKEQPQANDLLIYNTKQGIHGHVSVITEVKDGLVYIAEQNYANAPWEKPHYARSIPLIKDEKGNYSLKDLGVIGWMRIEP